MTADEIKKRREALSLSQKQLAEVLGISKRTVEDWEYGRGKPAPYLELAFCELERRRTEKRKRRSTA